MWERDFGWVLAVRGDSVWFSCSHDFSFQLCSSVPLAFGVVSSSPSRFVRSFRRLASSIALPPFVISLWFECVKSLN